LGTSLASTEDSIEEILRNRKGREYIKKGRGEEGGEGGESSKDFYGIFEEVLSPRELKTLTPGKEERK